MSHDFGGGLTVDYPPVVVERYREGGPAKAFALSLTGQVIAQVMSQSATKSRLVILFEKLTDAQMQTLRTILNRTDPLSVDTGEEVVLVLPAGDETHEITPIVADYGKDFPTELKLWRAKCVFARI